MSLRGKIDFAEITDTGRVRDHNEDAIGSNPDIGLLVLADGMGGYNAGEVASGIAVQIVSELAAEGATREHRDEIDPHSGLMRQSIDRACSAGTRRCCRWRAAASRTSARSSARGRDPSSAAAERRPRLRRAPR